MPTSGQRARIKYSRGRPSSGSVPGQSSHEHAHRSATTADGRSERQMELISSVSRSGGLEKGGDALKDFKIQDEYRAFIRGKVDAFWAKYPSGRCGHSTPESASDVQKCLDAQQNILILFRKLREGLVASNRRDAFAAEVYETSLYLSLIFSATRHVSSTISHFTPSRVANAPNVSYTVGSMIVTCLYHLLSTVPSQAIFHDHLRALPISLLPWESPARKWLLSMAKALREVNYTQFELISQPRSYAALLPPPTEREQPHLPKKALETVLAALRVKARERTWAVMRSAYRELWCHDGSETAMWLGRCLCLEENERENVDRWLEAKEKEGQVKKKEGMEGRWILCRSR